MTDTTAAPEDRYVVTSYGPNEYKIHDRSNGRDEAHGWFSTRAGARALAQRLNREARMPPACAPASPSGDSAEERYRVALNKISRYGDEYSRRTADDALFACTPLAKGRKDDGA